MNAPVKRWPLLTQPPVLIAYICLVAGVYLAVTAVEAVGVPAGLPILATFAGLLLCGGICVEATRRLGNPAGVSRDLLSAWWLPVALLLPPLYALLAPIPMYLLLHVRGRPTLVFRRVLSTVAIGLSGALTSVAFHACVPGRAADPAPWLVAHPVPGVGCALLCGLLFIVLNTGIVAVAAHTGSPELRWSDVLWDGEAALLDVVELSLGVLVTLICALAPVLLVVTFPPVVLLQRSLLHQQLRAAARTDAKTGLLNAAAWQRETDNRIRRARRDEGSLAVLLLDIDHFKRVNDRCGHLVGDRVLAAVAAALGGQLRDYDLLGRFGGEEFIVTLPDADMIEACRVAERLRTTIAGLTVPADDGTAVRVTISIGVAMFRSHGDGLTDLLAAADVAVYRAKRSGRDQVCLAHDDEPAGPGGAAGTAGSAVPVLPRQAPVDALLAARTPSSSSRYPQG